VDLLDRRIAGSARLLCSAAAASKASHRAWSTRKIWPLDAYGGDFALHLGRAVEVWIASSPSRRPLSTLGMLVILQLTNSDYMCELWLYSQNTDIVHR